MEQFDINILKFQNKKLGERLEVKAKVESDLRQRIEQLEKKQTSAEAIVYVINRYWNQLNEDLRILLQRFDAETSDQQENDNENEATTSFISQLSTWDKDELEENLRQRVEVSKRAVSKVIATFDRIVQRNEKITFALKGTTLGDGDTDNGESNPSLDEAVKKANQELQNENKNLNSLVTSLHEKHHKMSLKFSEMKDSLESMETRNDELKARIDDLEFDLNRTRSKEIRLQDNLQDAREKLQTIQMSGGDYDFGTNGKSAKNRSDNVNHAKFEDLQKELEEYKELSNKRLNELETLNSAHKEALTLIEKLKMDLQTLPEAVVVETVEYKCLQSHFSVLYNESMHLKTQLEEARSMMVNSKTAHLRQIEHMESEELEMQKRLRTEVIQLEDQLEQVKKEYEMLRIEFEQAIAANEQTGPINKEMRHLITSLQNHNVQLKGEAARYKRRLKDLQHDYNKIKHICETQHQNLITSNANSNSVNNNSNTNNNVPNNSSINSQPVVHANIKSNIKIEPGVENIDDPPTKRQRTDSGTDVNLIKDGGNKEIDEKKPGDLSVINDNSRVIIKKEREDSSQTNIHTTSSTTTATTTSSGNIPYPSHSHPSSHTHRSNHHLKKEEDSGETSERPNAVRFSGVSHDENKGTSGGGTSGTISISSNSLSSGSRKLEPELVIKDLQKQLRAMSQQNKEMRMVIDSYKTSQRDQRDKVALMTAEKKSRMEVEDLKKQLAKHQESDRRDRRKYADEETQREIAKYKENIQQLQKLLASQKQEDEALLNEMEVTGNAFEDMQEQNLRLMQQLRERDEANFKLMSERIKSQGILNLLKEEKENLNLQVINLKAQVEAQNQVVRKLEEKERLLQNNLSTVEKELSLTQQAMEQNRRKAIESAQSAADLKLHLDKYLSQLKEAQATVADKTSTLQQEAFKNQRLQEEVMTWRRLYERAKKFELATTADEVLQEEIKEYKSQLTCPSCKTNRKDAVLTKCFHVFCYECLKTRYETRQRKCPKCNALFGANDFHRLYLG
ncbi:E3 ubiquitin-protein ligase Bre1-like [Panonychus citri]|uniref:E3 ubiquitin-protein ligase Bre1-like n=1 Tax=Panonychus citri TaxID=50023 RepID=UPI002306E08B|nr:E3 ubiquitin-protein ligase Bre1-like [Panonychus citri]